MSMTALFVQVDEVELARLRRDAAAVEALFDDEVGGELAGLGALTAGMQERIRTQGPALLAQALARFDPETRRQLEAQFGLSMAALGGGQGGDALLRLMEERQGGRPGQGRADRPRLDLDKDWHGVHYLLCGEREPGASPASQAVMGGAALAGDDDAFGYGPPRFFAPQEVAGLAAVLGRPETEVEAAARFDADRMSAMQIYPGWDPSDREPLLDSFRRLRDFYAEAAAGGRAIVTCLL
jgi:hypothetical protein